MNKLKKTFILFILASILIPVYLSAASLHAILVINTEDKTIGCKYDLINIKKEIKNISKYTGMKLKLKVFSGKKWSRPAIMKAIKKLQPGKNDMLFFYYSGHGYRFKSKKVKWPSMALQHDKGLDQYWVYKEFSKKKARFIMVLSDSCNNIIPEGVIHTVRSFSSKSKIKYNYKKLFLNFKGAIIASGCIAGQFSYGGAPDGGAYTSTLRRSIELAVKSKNPSWKEIMKRSNKPLMNGKQQPQYEINLLSSSIITDNKTDNKIIEKIDNNSNDNQDSNVTDENDCNQLIETLNTLEDAYSSLKNKRRLNKRSKNYKKLKEFLESQLIFAKEDKDKYSTKEYKKYLTYLKKSKWWKLKPIVEGYKNDWEKFYKKDCAQETTSKDDCRDLKDIYEMMEDALADLNYSKTLKKNSPAYKELKEFFIEQRKYAKEDGYKDTEKEFTKYLKYLKNGKWKTIKIIITEFKNEWKKSYKNECSKK